MNPRVVFWIAAAVRIVLIFLVAGVVAYFFGIVHGSLVAVFGLLIILVIQLRYLLTLSDWLIDPQSTRLADGWGAWTEVFARLYKLRREDERNQAELSEWLARFRQAMSLLPDGVVIMDEVLQLEWCNPVAEQHLGLQLAQDKGMRVTNLVRAPSFIDYIVLGRYQTPLHLEFRGKQFLVHVIPFENRRQIVVTHDVTESERIDMMRRDFIANASHELRTPLTVINGFLEIAVSEPSLDADTRASHLSLMVEQGQRMQRLVEDMLTLSRLESMDDQARKELIPMAKLVARLSEEASALSAGRHQIRTEIDAPDLLGNPDEIHSALGNLISNAIRYTPTGGEIVISWRREAAALCFSVRDNGIGIAPEHIARLTERFYRVDKSRSRETQGTGLGLAIVKHVLLRHSGQLLIESEPLKGSRFTASFPYLT